MAESWDEEVAVLRKLLPEELAAETLRGVRDDEFARLDIPVAVLRRYRRIVLPIPVAGLSAGQRGGRVGG